MLIHEQQSATGHDNRVRRCIQQTGYDDGVVDKGDATKFCLGRTDS